MSTASSEEWRGHSSWLEYVSCIQMLLLVLSSADFSSSCINGEWHLLIMGDIVVHRGLKVMASTCTTKTNRGRAITSSGLESEGGYYHSNNSPTSYIFFSCTLRTEPIACQSLHLHIPLCVLLTMSLLQPR